MALGLPARRVGHVQTHAQNKLTTVPIAGIPVHAEEAGLSVYARMDADSNSAGGVATNGNTNTAVAGYFEAQLSGEVADGQSIYANGCKLRFLAGSSTFGGGSLICAQKNSINDVSGVVFASGTNLVFGMKAEFVANGTVTTTGVYPFSINSNQTIRALFYCQDTGGDVGYLPNTGVSSTKEGDVPLFADSGGGQHYVRIYDARG